MHMPALKISRKRIGVTGDIRFRKQWFTGKQILQVAVIYEVRKWRYPWDLKDENLPFKTEVEWEDADASVGLRVSTGMAPFERRLSGGIVRPSEAPRWPSPCATQKSKRCPSCCYDDCQCELKWGKE